MAKKVIKRTDSKDSVRGYTYNKDYGTVFPDFQMENVLAGIDDDPVANGAVQHFVDRAMEGDYAIIRKDEVVYDKQFEQKLDDEYNFRHNILRKTLLVGKLFQNVFIELVKKTDGSVKALNVLDSANINPVTAPNGDPIKYVSTIPNPITGDFPEWTKDEVIWVKFNDRTNGFASVNLKSLWQNLVTKSYVKQYVAWLWQTGQYRIIYNFESASDKSIDDFITYARKHDENFRAPFITKGKMKNTLLRDMREQGDIVNYLKYLDSQTLIALRIPPIDAGIPDASGRSNADAQSNNLDAHISSYKKVVEDMFNYALFPAMNKGNNAIKFAPNDRFQEEQVLTNVNLMQSMNMTEDVIIEYLHDRGMFFTSKKIFKELPVQQPGAPAKQSDAAPSRQPATDGKPKAVGQPVTTRPDQVSQK